MENGEAIAEPGDQFIAFDDEGEVRGVGVQVIPTFGPHVNSILYEMTIGSNNIGDNISFKYCSNKDYLIFEYFINII